MATFTYTLGDPYQVIDAPVESLLFGAGILPENIGVNVNADDTFTLTHNGQPILHFASPDRQVFYLTSFDVDGSLYQLFPAWARAVGEAAAEVNMGLTKPPAVISREVNFIESSRMVGEREPLWAAHPDPALAGQSRLDGTANPHESASDLPNFLTAFVAHANNSEAGLGTLYGGIDVDRLRAVGANHLQTTGLQADHLSSESHYNLLMGFTSLAQQLGLEDEQSVLDSLNDNDQLTSQDETSWLFGSNGPDRVVTNVDDTWAAASNAPDFLNATSDVNFLMDSFNAESLVNFGQGTSQPHINHGGSSGLSHHYTTIQGTVQHGTPSVQGAVNLVTTNDGLSAIVIEGDNNLLNDTATEGADIIHLAGNDNFVVTPYAVEASKVTVEGDRNTVVLSGEGKDVLIAKGNDLIAFVGVDDHIVVEGDDAIINLSLEGKGKGKFGLINESADKIGRTHTLQLDRSPSDVVLFRRGEDLVIGSASPDGGQVIIPGQFASSGNAGIANLSVVRATPAGAQMTSLPDTAIAMLTQQMAHYTAPNVELEIDDIRSNSDLMNLIAAAFQQSQQN